MCVLGKTVPDDYLDGMINEAPGPINFTMFLTMFGEKLTGTDPEEVIKNAFGCFDDEGTGQCRASNQLIDTNYCDNEIIN